MFSSIPGLYLLDARKAAHPQVPLQLQLSRMPSPLPHVTWGVQNHPNFVLPQISVLFSTEVICTHYKKKKRIKVCIVKIRRSHSSSVVLTEGINLCISVHFAPQGSKSKSVKAVH